MLVLTRRVGERILIGGGIILTVVRIQGDKVRLGITAPPEVEVHREEVFLRLQAARRAAGVAGSPATPPAAPQP